jgi:hypothetical protein
MKQLLFATLLLASPVSAQEVYSVNINKLCAGIVGIPYASDNFTDLEWQQFQDCVKYVKQFKS